MKARNMSQEIQLSLTPSNSASQMQTPSWSGPAPGVLGPATPAAPSTPLAKVHQHLRGRYGITLLLAGIFAVLGGGAGFFLFHPGYESHGSIEIDPVITSPDMYDHIMPLWQAYVATVVSNLHSETVMREAMHDPEWKANRPLPPEAYLDKFGKDLVIKLAPGSFVINITYTDDKKDGKVVAPIAVRAVIESYKKLFGNDERANFERKINVWKKQQINVVQNIKNDESLIDQMLQNLGDDPQTILNEKYQTHFALQKQVRDLEEMLRIDRAELKLAQQQAGNQPYSVEDLARVDPAMQVMYSQHSIEDQALKALTQRLGGANPYVIAQAANLAAMTDRMNDYAQSLRGRYFIKMKPDGSGGVLISKDLSVKESNLKHMQEMYAEEQLQLDDLGHRTHEVHVLRAEKTRYDEERIRDDKKIEELTNQRDMANTFRVIDPGGMASIGTDKRIIFGGVGFMAGAVLPIGLMLMASLLNPRFRFSDETGTQDTSGLALLGILPDLPDRLSDPEQASIAAHCVHQIRTMLQINTAGGDDRRVFAITSAAPADGKTSLTLALGLSYAACGTRTLLIDCDLIGAGLTSRLNVVAADGVLEAIAHRSLLEYVRTTDIADVSILPVGSGQHLHASTLSPAALRRLIEEAKKHFDTILIDTGPVLGSIEASLVAAAADAVVLTVSRGQQRPLVEKTVQHLHNIKANLAGVVFNRAQTDDFDRSISGISLRSAARGSSYNAPRMGPVARAVQSAFKPAGEEE
ncbi:MAG TPA: AAA family ATPase [Tepidisphaeraceae bacterium]|jgi:capsular exopolysaccharide synthesis family protein|nr:AAA family ATPase [Tepidisphaeraceae bacterium]